MNVQIIYLTKADQKLSSLAYAIASNVINKLQPLIAEIRKEEVKIFIYFGKGNSKIKINASMELEKAMSRFL